MFIGICVVLIPTQIMASWYLKANTKKLHELEEIKKEEKKINKGEAKK